MRKRKRIISYLTVLTILFSTFAGIPKTQVFAEDSEDIEQSKAKDGDTPVTSGASIILNRNMNTTGAELILHYDMKTTEISGGNIIVKDVSGNNKAFDGIFKNTQNGYFLKDDQVGYIAFNGGGSTSSSGYVEIPKGSDGSDILENVNGGVTVSTLVNWQNDGMNRWIF